MVPRAPRTGNYPAAPPFFVAFPKPLPVEKHITANTNIWESVLGDPHFTWRFPTEEGVAVNAIMEECVRNAQGKIPMVLDGGANMGFFTLAAASCGCDVVAYEPCQTCVRFINLSGILSGLRHRITTRAVAITDKAKKVGFNGWETMPEGSFEGVRIDQDVHSFLDTHYFLYLKVDIQGSEHDALRGATDLLRNQQIRYVAFEAQLNRQPESCQDAFAQLCQHGYLCLDVENPKAILECSAPLAHYTGVVCANLPKEQVCERYIICSPNAAKVEKLRTRLLSI